MRTIAFVLFFFVFMGLMMSQNLKIIAQNSLDCTGRKKEFTVPQGKTYKLKKLDIIVPSWNSCNQSEPAPTEVYAQIITKPLSIKETPKVLYKQVVKPSGEKSETISIGKVKLTPGTYILEISRAPRAEAILEYFAAEN